MCAVGGASGGPAARRAGQYMYARAGAGFHDARRDGPMRGGCSQKDPAGVSCTGLLRSQPGGPSPFRPRNLFATASQSHRRARASIRGHLHLRDGEGDAAQRANAGLPSILSANPGKVAGSRSQIPPVRDPCRRSPPTSSGDLPAHAQQIPRNITNGDLYRYRGVTSPASLPTPIVIPPHSSATITRPASRPFAFDVRPRSDSTHAACACRSSAQPARVHLRRRSTRKPCPRRTLVNATGQGAAILRVARIGGPLSLGAMCVQ